MEDDLSKIPKFRWILYFGIYSVAVIVIFYIENKGDFSKFISLTSGFLGLGGLLAFLIYLHIVKKMKWIFPSIGILALLFKAIDSYIKLKSVG